MSENSGAARGGIGFAGLLTIVFVVLKLCGIGKVATWSWWWVLSPIWISWGLIIIIGIIVYFVYKWAENNRW